MARPSILPRMEGFTLLEIMVALAIFAHPWRRPFCQRANTS